MEKISHQTEPTPTTSDARQREPEEIEAVITDEIEKLLAEYGTECERITAKEPERVRWRVNVRIDSSMSDEDIRRVTRNTFLFIRKNATAKAVIPYGVEYKEYNDFEFVVINTHQISEFLKASDLSNRIFTIIAFCGDKTNGPS